MARSTAVLWLLLFDVMGEPALAQEPHASSRFEIGLRAVLLFGKGEPANDMMGEGLVGRLQLRGPWVLGIALDTVTFDYETPNRTVGIPAAAVVDGSNEWSRTSVFIERRFQGERRWSWFWLAGIGRASVDAVASVAGTSTAGTPFEIVTVAEDELHVFAGGGLRRPLGEHWRLDTTFTVEHHDTDYLLEDRLSPARGTIGAQNPYGIAIGVSYRF